MDIKKKISQFILIFFFLTNTHTSFAENSSEIPAEINMNISWKSLKRYAFYIDQLKKSFITDPISIDF